MQTYKGRTRILKANGKIYNPFKDVLIFDIETKKIDTNKGIDADNSKFVIWGAYSFNTNKVYYGKGNNFKQLLDTHKILVGHNIKGFDIPIMKRDLGLDFWGKTIIDTLEVLRKPPSKSEKEAMLKKGKQPIYGRGRSLIIGEARQIGMKDNRFPNFKLSTIAKHGYELFKNHEIYSHYFNEYKDEDFDYDILAKENKTKEDWKIIKDYLKKDLVVTKNIFEFLEKYFESFAEGLSDNDIENLEYAFCSMGKYVYKIFCNELGLEEKYGNSPKGKFPGAFVFLPTQEKYTPTDGDGYCIDFASQHPSHIRMMNLCTPIEKCKHKINDECPNQFKGDGKIFTFKGTYCACENGDIEKLITKWYLNRLEFKKNNDPREYSVKIKINGTYGELSSPIFDSTYYEFTGEDTTKASKQSTGFMSVWMKKGGYIVTYGDTDSLYIIDPFKNKERMKHWMNKGIKEIVKIMPFADEHYKMDIDAEFSHIFFFQDEKSKDKHYKKKNYIYITKDRKVKINGLPILKSNAPKLAKYIYNNILEKEILRTNNIKFEKENLKQMIFFEIKKDINLLKSNIKVNPASNYASETQMQAQISKKYFMGKEGNFVGIKHLRKGYGIGKGKHYCNLEEAKKLKIHEYDLETVWKALDPFIKKDKQMTLI